MQVTWGRAAAMILVGLALLAACGGDAPTADDAEVQAALDELAIEVEDAADELARVARSELPAGAEVVATRAYRDCTEGQHDWKRDDPFDLSCVVGHAVVVAVPSDATFRADMAELDDALQATGLADRRSEREDSQGLAHVAEDYFGLLGHELSIDPDGQPVIYGPQDLPPASYNSAEDDLELTLAFTGPRDEALARSDDQYRDPAGRRLDPGEVLDLLTDQAYALVVDVHADEAW
ncbi:hypothetical protein [Salsipaludibacter albus]|uniref:hypothetical protein n=1 Tax=Salsipaludibacter albus TaxID=2849650 RepID=UPI001EE3D438|nr:hypothetical protein [Salsipaludibacter albus]MBY5162079.1 hypothetical protein [Salsipaludibacter albus]